jgi:hypothetical protein
MRQQKSCSRDYAIRPSPQRRSGIRCARDPSGKEHRPTVGYPDCLRQELQSRPDAAQVPAGFTSLSDESVDTPIKHPTRLVHRADHCEYEYPRVFEPPHQITVATEGHDRHVDPRFNANRNVAAAQKWHQQIDSNRPIGDLVSNPSDPFAQPRGRNQA